MHATIKVFPMNTRNTNPFSVSGNPSGDGSLWRPQIPILSRKQWNVEVSRDWGVPMLRQGIFSKSKK
ncbi:hypothetical protein SLA2020_046550 [Shorea laevis]